MSSYKKGTYYTVQNFTAAYVGKYLGKHLFVYLDEHFKQQGVFV